MNSNLINVHKNLNHFIKEVKVSGKTRHFFDFDKIAAEGFPFNLVISQREALGKTYNVKDYLYKHWNQKRNLGAYWVRTLKDNIKDSEKNNFLSDVPMDIQEHGFTVDGNYVKDKNKKRWIKFGNVQESQGRGSREIVQQIVWDEFNLGLSGRNSNSILSNWMNLLSSVSNKEMRESKDWKVFLLGNNRSFDHPFMVAMGISSIKDEVTHIYDKNGNPLMLILFPIMDAKDIKELDQQNIDDPLYQVAKLTGEAESMYYNMSALDDVNSICTFFNFSLDGFVKQIVNGKETLFDINNLNLAFTYRVNGHLLNVYNVPKQYRKQPQWRFHVVDVNLFIQEANRTQMNGLSDLKIEDMICHNQDGSLAIWSPKKKWMVDGDYLLPPIAVNNLLNMISSNNMSYENAVSKNYYYQLFQK